MLKIVYIVFVNYLEKFFATEHFVEDLFLTCNIYEKKFEEKFFHVYDYG